MSDAAVTAVAGNADTTETETETVVVEPASDPPPPMPEAFATLCKKLESDDGFESAVVLAPDSNFLHRIEGEKRMYVNTDVRKVVGFFSVGASAEGPPGMVHGGALFTMVDNTLGVCACRSMACLCFTANVSINYRAPSYLGAWLRVEAEVDRVEKEKKVFLKFAAYGPDETKLVEGTSLFIAKLGVPSSL